MLVLPERISVHAVSSLGTQRGVGGVLVSLRTLRHGSAYYSTALGLTDTEGWIRVGGETIQQAFTRNQDLFPFDYRVALEDCDPEIEIYARGGADFERWRAETSHSTLVRSDVKSWYDNARNGEFESTSRRAELSTDTALADLMVELEMRSRVP
jgi:hypothetical protein